MSQVKLAERKRGDMHVISLQHRVFKRAQKVSHMTSRKLPCLQALKVINVVACF
jgi:hypothetical protein